ncbi:MAG: biosynthetic-type acetolactate synthase large subunit [Heliobacteriaceae bacterium]|nr:biosynthetic-type acetolactate synthase large subunit [Heliobacteriaceae bacterium]
MEMNGAQVLLACLEANGVEVVFGYPGGAVLPIYDALRGSRLRHILVRCEQGAAHAANGYARVAGKPGVCIATSGPGATNLVTGIANAYMDSIPLVLITGQVATSLVGTDAFQEVDITGITIPITKHNYLVKDPAEIPVVVHEAFHIAATGRPGPVLIDIPRDVQEAVCPVTDLSPGVTIKGYKLTVKGHPSQIRHAVKLINAAVRPVVMVGGGVIQAQAAPELFELATRCNLPVATTLMGVGAFPETHPLALGLMGTHGTLYANRAVSQADLLIGIGVRFGDRATGDVKNFAPAAKIIHVDIDPAEIGKNANIDVPIVGDAKTVLAEINEKAAVVPREEWMAQVMAWKKAAALKYDQGRLTAPYIIEMLGDLTRDQAWVATDVGQHQLWTALFYKFVRPGSLITSGGLGCMGYGLPAANGVQVARPGDLVLLITGDGSLQMTLAELATARQERLPLKIILFNNNCLGMVRQLQHFYREERYFGVDLTGNPSFAALAGAYGLKAYRITTRQEAGPVLRAALAEPGPVLVEVVVDAADLLFPTVLNGTNLEAAVQYGGEPAKKE